MATPGRDDADVIGRLLVSVYEIHERVIARGGGGLEGIRDAGLLHAAVARPFATFGAVELYPTDFDKAAALFHSLIKSYPFLDGTKRTAFAAAVYFLHERGYTLQRPFLKDDIIRFCVGLAEEGQRLAVGEQVTVQTIRQIAEWLKGLVGMPASQET
jgi:death-on-curing family protein